MARPNKLGQMYDANRDTILRSARQRAEMLAAAAAARRDDPVAQAARNADVPMGYPSPVWPPCSEFPNTIRPSDLTGPPFSTNASNGFNAQRRRERAAEEARQRTAVWIPGNIYGLNLDDDPFATAAVQPSSPANATSNAQRRRTEEEARRRAARNPGNVFGFDPDEDADADAN